MSARAMVLAALAGQWLLVALSCTTLVARGGGQGGGSAANGSPGSGLEPPTINPAPGALDLQRTATVAAQGGVQ